MDHHGIRADPSKIMAILPMKSPCNIIEMRRFMGMANQLGKFSPMHNNLLLFNHRIVIPQAVQKETLKKIHEGHQGIERCRMRVKASVWWPGVSKKMEQMVLQCPVCAKAAQVHKEPLIASQLPAYPWQVAGSDLFELEGEHHILVVDYFSRYPEVNKLKSTNSVAVH